GYSPMVELLRYLEGHGFTCYIASGGGRDFMRVISEEVYGIPPERVIGSSVGLEYRERDAGSTIVHLAEVDLFDDGPAKPVAVWNRTGRRPIFAAGNSNGDLQMLRFAGGGSHAALRMAVLHDDGEREFAYEAGAERLLEEAKASAWTVVSMKDDWARVFPRVAA
ncbi:MAG: haloacid dehalogenase-like hydrolase, partial [Gemmatimonadales bacterium]